MACFIQPPFAFLHARRPDISRERSSSLSKDRGSIEDEDSKSTKEPSDRDARSMAF